MMFTFKVENDRGELLNLSTSPDYTVYRIDGLTPPRATISTSANATMDGSSINNARVEKRNVVIYATINGNVESKRINLYKYFPVKRMVKLYFTNGTRETVIEGIVELIECNPFSKKQVVQISIICPQPYFKNVDNFVTNFSDVNNLFEFPFSIPAESIEFSAITTNIRKSIINNGDVPTGASIELFATGTVVNPVLYNVLKRTHLSLNFTMLPSDKIVINTNVGEKSVTLIRSGVSTNILGYMVHDSDWFTLESGDNVFTYDAESGNNNLRITFTTALLYSGV